MWFYKGELMSLSDWVCKYTMYMTSFPDSWSQYMTLVPRSLEPVHDLVPRSLEPVHDPRSQILGASTWPRSQILGTSTWPRSQILGASTWPRSQILGASTYHTKSLGMRLSCTQPADAAWNNFHATRSKVDQPKLCHFALNFIVIAILLPYFPINLPVEPPSKAFAQVLFLLLFDWPMQERTRMRSLSKSV